MTHTPITIPYGGSRPLHPSIAREARRPELKKHGERTRARVTRNWNVAPLERLHHYDRITQSQYEAGVVYRQCHARAFPARSNAFQERVDISGRNSGEHNLDAQDRLRRCGQLMQALTYKALQGLIIDELTPLELAQIMRVAGVKGWSKNLINTRIGEALDDLARVWPKTRRR